MLFHAACGRPTTGRNAPALAVVGDAFSPPHLADAGEWTISAGANTWLILAGPIWRWRMTRRRIILVGISMFAVALTAGAADWPQWRGPQRTGISTETGLLKEWPEGGPKLLWKVSDIDYGYSTPAVVGERMYLLSNKGNDNEFVQALSVKDGKQIWTTQLGKVGPNYGMPYPAARSTPT